MSEIYGLLISQLILTFLPIADYNVRMHVGILINDLMRRKFWKNITWFRWCSGRQVIIADRMRDSEINPLFEKLQEYITNKFVSKIESCELAPKNGDIEFVLSELHGKKFIDEMEIAGILHTFELTIMAANENTFDEKSKSVRQIVIHSKTATSEEIRLYVKRINGQAVKTVNCIRIYKPLIQGKKMTEQTVEWEPATVRTNKTLSNTIYSEKVLTDLFQDIDTFMSNEQWYAHHGIPYKRGYFLHSTPGQGKTSVAKITANKFNLPVFCLDLSTVNSNSTLVKLMNSIHYYTNHREHVLLIEDLDRTTFMKHIGYERFGSTVTMDAFLNVIDGVDEPHARITILTANNPSVIMDHPALIRPGRIDRIIEFVDCDLSQIQRLFKLYYDKSNYQVNWDEWNISESYSAAYIVKQLQENIENPERFLKLVGEKKTPKENKDKEAADADAEAILKEKLKYKQNEARLGKQNKSRRGYTVGIAGDVRRAKYIIKRDDQRVEALTRRTEKFKQKLPILLEKIAKRKERERIRNAKEKAKLRAKSLRAKLIKDMTGEYDEEEYETPAFLLGKISAEEVAAGTTTTYEYMEDPDAEEDLDEELAMHKKEFEKELEKELENDRDEEEIDKEEIKLDKEEIKLDEEEEKIPVISKRADNLHHGGTIKKRRERVEFNFYIPPDAPVMADD
jgi:SpoVK/Ycf46/Vps4 family AAA+-type ATPase